MVVFEGGTPKKSDYRRFTIRGLTEGVPDDFAAMEEVLSRRMKQWEAQQDLSPHDPNRNESFATLPNVVVIDGGPGSSARACGASRVRQPRAWPVISLAKRIEEVFVPGRPAPILLDHDTPGAAAPAARARRGAPLRDHPPPPAPRQVHAHLGAGRAARGRARGASARCCSTSARPRPCSPPRATSSRAFPGLPGKTARDLYAFLHRTSSA
jgi:excinuclease ABC subunit C